MITKLNQFQSDLTKVFLLIYVSGTLNMSAYEVIHLFLHIGDIVSLDYAHHSHEGSDVEATITHSHNDILDQIEDNPCDEEDTDFIPTFDDNPSLEIVHQLLPLRQQYQNNTKHNYEYIRTIRYLETTLPPPKVNDEIIV